MDKLINEIVESNCAYGMAHADSVLEAKEILKKYLNGLKEQLLLHNVSQQRELLEALKGIIQCCDGNEPKHEQIYHIANDAVKACNCG